MKWNVIVRDITTGTIGPYNIFDCADFRIVKNVLDAYKQALEQAQTNSQTQSQTSGSQTMQQM